MNFIQDLLFSFLALLVTMIGKLLDAIMVRIAILAGCCLWAFFCLGILYPVLCHTFAPPRPAVRPPAPPAVATTPSQYDDPRFPGAITLKRPDTY